MIPGRLDVLGVHTRSGINEVALMHNNLVPCHVWHVPGQPSVGTPVIRVHNTPGKETSSDYW